MSLASSRVGLTHRCTIQRQTATPDGGGGQTLSWSAVATDVACRAWFQDSTIETAGEQPNVVTDRRLIVPVDTDVQAGDRVASVTHRGEALFPGPMGVDTVGRFPAHLELFVREID